ncbi:MAG: flagellar biosynthesis anti-sigma factor FlgM [Armatimonadetes bacterium]|nr:flagellar biosynthesis anti-sigma factor FlgM [Armatimonadota bacterium]
MEPVGVQRGRGPGEPVPRHELVADDMIPGETLRDDWPLVAATVERIRRMKDTVRTAAVSTIRELLQEGSFEVDADVVAGRILEEPTQG